MIWWKGKNHITDRYICMINLKRINPKNKHHAEYPYVSSAIRPIPQGLELLVPEPDGNMKYSSDSEHSGRTVEAGDNAYKLAEDDQLVPLTQIELNYQTRD